MKYIKLLLIATVLFTAISCDVIEPPYKEKHEIVNDSTKQKILIEEFTGFRCGNCPEAAEKGHLIASSSQGQVIMISIHAGDLANVTPIRTYNFTTPEGTDIAEYYNLTATPYGMVNRVKMNGANLLSPDSWSSAVAIQSQKQSTIELKLTSDYNSSNREITLNANMKFLQIDNRQLHIAVYIVEDSVVQYQKDDRKSDPNVLDYVHNHVFRGSFNGAWGDLISSTPILAQQVINKNFNYTIPSNKDWRPNKLSLIAVIMDNQTKEVAQVEKVSLFE